MTHILTLTLEKVFQISSNRTLSSMILECSRVLVLTLFRDNYMWLWVFLKFPGEFLWLPNLQTSSSVARTFVGWWFWLGCSFHRGGSGKCQRYPELLRSPGLILRLKIKVEWGIKKRVWVCSAYERKSKWRESMLY